MGSFVVRQSFEQDVVFAVDDLLVADVARAVTWLWTAVRPVNALGSASQHEEG
tara:strand:- start:381 stop:539 length:159 start_codon:yes stop_codon:yes gene_type:complete